MDRVYFESKLAVDRALDFSSEKVEKFNFDEFIKQLKNDGFIIVRECL